MNRILEIAGEFIYVFLYIILLPLLVLVHFFIYSLILAKFVKRQGIKLPRMKAAANRHARYSFPAAMSLKNA